MSVFCAMDWAESTTEDIGKVLEMADVCFAEGTWPCAGGDDGFHPRKGTGKETEEESGELRGLDVSERVVAPTKPPPDRGLGEEVTPGPPAAPAGPDGLLGSNGSVGFPNRSTTGFIQIHTIATTPSTATKIPRINGSFANGSFANGSFAKGTFIILFMFIGFRIPNRYENKRGTTKYSCSTEYCLSVYTD